MRGKYTGARGPFGMIQIGLECCLENPPAVIERGRFGLLMNHASVDCQFRYSFDLLGRRFPGQLVAMFSPQHGVWGEQQANMIESPHGRFEPPSPPLYSLYSETRQPTPEMLHGLDCLIVDLQDVGTRVYTYIWTVSYCLQACAAAGIPLVVLDRPNPLGGKIAEGPVLEAGFESFVGRTSIPMRHGLTLGELAELVNHDLKIGAEIIVVRMEGWRRDMLFQDTGRSWVPTSPNMPTVSTTLLYPGQVMLEGTNLSEGRGTTIPFELVGAPFIYPFQLADEMKRQDHPGLFFRPMRFVPTFDKWRGQSCGGIAIHIVDAYAARSFAATVAILAATRKLWPSEMQWLPPPYEYEHIKMPIDILYGSSRLRETLDKNAAMTTSQLDDLTRLDVNRWNQRASNFHLYD
jgi:uncharacterized protein YbbC (DUF1343 family)